MTLTWTNLTQDERSFYMMLQMSPRYGGRSAYLPDDCSECGFCGTPMLGSGGFCNTCYSNWQALRDKLED